MVYLFGDFGTGFTQYPQDGAATVLRRLAQTASESAQVQTRMVRDGGLMYYVYLHRMDEGAGQYLGFAVVLGTASTSEPDGLWETMEEAFENVVIANRILTINDREHIVTNVASLGNELIEAERVRKLIEHRLTGQGKTETPRETRFTRPVEETLPTEEPPSGETPVTPEPKQPVVVKKGGKGGWVCFWLLLLAVAGVCVWGYLDWNTLSHLVEGTRSETNLLTRRNRSLANDVGLLRDELDRKSEQLSELSLQLRQKDTLISALMDASHLRQPIVVTGLTVTREASDGYGAATVGREVSLNRGEQLRAHVRYIGLANGNAEVQLKIHEPGGVWIFFPKVRSLSRTVSVKEGSHTFDFQALTGQDHGIWESGEYKLEIIVDGEVRAKKTFYVR